MKLKKNDYREKLVKGCYFDECKKMLLPKPCHVMVRMTSDKLGQTLSFQAYNVMITIPLEMVTDIVKVVEK